MTGVIRAAGVPSELIISVCSLLFRAWVGPMHTDELVFCGCKGIGSLLSKIVDGIGFLVMVVATKVVADGSAGFKISVVSSARLLTFTMGSMLLSSVRKVKSLLFYGFVLS